jgi:hypothetical protein
MSALLQEHETASAAPARLLHGEGGTTLDDHVARYGPPPPVARRANEIVRVIEASGLTGRGGAGFPSATKLRSVSRGRRAVVVANGTEGEPASAKDRILMIRNPHLVLDGLEAAAALVGARSPACSGSLRSPPHSSRSQSAATLSMTLSTASRDCMRRSHVAARARIRTGRSASS